MAIKINDLANNIQQKEFDNGEFSTFIMLEKRDRAWEVLSFTIVSSVLILDFAILRLQNVL